MALDKRFFRSSRLAWTPLMFGENTVYARYRSAGCQIAPTSDLFERSPMAPSV